MNRRDALKSCGVAALITAGGFSAALSGCTSAQIENEINVILQGIANILAVSGETTWSKTLSNAEQALVQAEATWKAGGAIQILIDALNTVEDVTAVIPLTNQYSDFIDVIVAAIETVLVLLEPSVSGATNLKMAAKHNPHKGRIPNFKSGRKAAQEWNSIVSLHPNARVAKVKVPL